MNRMYELIKGLCDYQGISIAEMCRRVNIRQGLISDLKNGHSQSLKPENLKKIATYFNVSVDYFLDLGEISPSDTPPEPPITDDQLMFALWGDVKDELTEEDLVDVKKYADMVRLRKMEEKRNKKED